MKISYNWLASLLPVDKSAQDLAEVMTHTGLEVESMEAYERVRGGLRGLVIGEVVECEKHPDADRLHLTKVNVGNGQPLSIVCGAPNVAAGQKVVVATVGATLHPTNGTPFTIRKSKIRGAVSEGMICAEDEIGLGESHAGILVLPPDASPGTPASEFFSLAADTIFEIGLTPNRGDATSHLGVARDIAAALNTAAHNHQHAVVMPPLKSDLPVGEPVKLKIEDRHGCPRYSYLVVKGVQVTESPAWLQDRLRSVGLRPLNSVVDITNYVMMELGQPLHAFDLLKIGDSKIIVRTAYAGETLVTLDGIERKLSEKDLVIADSEKPMCIAGVLGGAASGVTSTTTDILIESAYFDPGTIRASARHHGLHSDAAFRFERGADPEMTVTALQRAAQLIVDIAPNTSSFEIHDEYIPKLEPYKVAFAYANCIDLIGKEVDRHLIKNILLNLGMTIDSEGTDGLLLYVPRYRSDVTREVDVMEEVLRIYGYNHVEPSRHITYTAPSATVDQSYAFEQKIATLLANAGFREIVGLSLTKESNYRQDQPLVKLLNPLSQEHAVLRADLLPSGLEAIAYNINRRNHDLRLFEFGRGYRMEKGTYAETAFLSVFITGDIHRQNPYGLKKKSDFAVLKNVVTHVFERCGIPKYSVSEQTKDTFDYGLTYSAGEQTLVEFGAVSAQTLRRADISQPVFFAQFHMQALRHASEHTVAAGELPKFPFVRRDLALLVDKSVGYGQIEALAFATEKNLLTAVNLFDIYEDAKLGSRRSYAVSFTLQNAEATLTDRQIDAVMDRLIAAYREQLGAELRE